MSGVRASGTGVLEVLARGVAGALSELGPLLTGGQVERIVAELGHPWLVEEAAQQQITAKAAGLAAAATSLGPKIDALTVASDSGDPDATIAAGRDLLAATQAVLGELDDLGALMDPLLASGTAQRADGAATGFAQTLLEHLLVRYLDESAPGITAVLELLGLVERSVVEGTRSRSSHLSRRVRFDRVAALVEDPGAVGRELYGWSEPGFTGAELLRRLAALFGSAGDLVKLSPEDEPTELEAYLFHLRVEGDGLVAGVRFPGVDADDRFELGGGWSVQLTAEAAFESEGLEVAVRPPLHARFLPLAGEVSVEAGLALVGEQVVLLSAGRFARLEAARVTAGVRLRTSVDVTDGSITAVPVVEVRIEGARLVTAANDGFVSSLTQGNPVDAGFDLTLLWSPQAGLSVQGGAVLHARLPVRFSALGLVDVNAAEVALDLDEQGLRVHSTLEFGAQLGPLRATVLGTGLDFRVAFPAGQVAGAGPSAEFVPPQSIALAIESSLLRGGGYLDYDPEREEYVGTLQVGRGKLLFTAIGLLTTGDPYSLVVLITASFRPIRLGYGFSLTGLGGLIGVNRTADVPALQQGMRDGALDSIMFPRDPVQNAPRLLADLRTYFPESQGSYLFGPMLQLGWGPTPILQAELGILLEVPDPLRLMLFGRVRVGLPTLRTALARINLEVFGALDLEAGTLALDARLFDSQIGFLSVSGEAAVRARWRDDPDFALSIGGFHPAFRPPAGFPALRRVTVDLTRSSNPRVRLQGYLALTTNSVQFGARVDAGAQVGKFSLEAFLSFDALFRFDPFRFVAELAAGAAIKRGDRTMLSVRLRLTLSGPQPWHVSGTASFRIVFAFTVRIDYTQGTAALRSPVSRVDLGELLATELELASSWTGQTPPDGGTAVTLREVAEPEPGTMVVHPQARLTIRQTLLPLGVIVDKLGDRAPLAGRKFDVTGVTLGGEPVGHRAVTDGFAPAEFFDLTDRQRLQSPAYEDHRSGVEVETGGATVGDRVYLEPYYEQTVIGAGAGAARGVRREFGRVPVPERLLARQALRSAAIAASGFRQRVTSASGI